jgi:endonuclease/exonuclease/phosphatase (EEP) superfamily protein YafD
MRLYLNLAFSGFLLCFLIALAGPLGWPMDLFSHFQIQALAAGAVFAVLFAILKARWQAAVASLCAAVAFWQVGSTSIWNRAALADEDGENQITVVAANVGGRAEALDAVLRQIGTEKLDLAVLTELPNAATSSGVVLSDDLPHLAGRPALAAPGLSAAVLLSARPMAEAKLIEVNGNPAAILRARYCRAASTSCLTIFALHPMPPTRAAFYIRQKSMFERLAVELDATEGPVLVAGDFNATPWSPLLKRLVNRTGLKKVVCGGVLTPTWMSTTPGLGLPIDHFFMRGGIRSAECKTGTFSGSDHVPITGRFILPQAISR